MLRVERNIANNCQFGVMMMFGLLRPKIKNTGTENTWSCNYVGGYHANRYYECVLSVQAI